MTAPKRNTFSNANRTRDPHVAEELYRTLSGHLQNVCSTFGKGRLKGALAKFKLRNVYAIDSSTPALSLKCMDWAKHRRRKAAAKLHVRTDVACMLPRLAIVEVDGRKRPMVFLTNNMQWAASTIAELYKARWTVEPLFRELKQTLQLRTFYDENEKAVKWQVWTALIVHLPLRFIRHLSKWTSSYSRLVGIVRAMIGMKIDLMAILENFVHYGTASPPKTPLVAPKALFLPGFERLA